MIIEREGHAINAFLKSRYNLEDFTNCSIEPHKEGILFVKAHDLILCGNIGMIKLRNHETLEMWDTTFCLTCFNKTVPYCKGTYRGVFTQGCFSYIDHFKRLQTAILMDQLDKTTKKNLNNIKSILSHDDKN